MIYILKAEMVDCNDFVDFRNLNGMNDISYHLDGPSDHSQFKLD